jgi:hypothetical protein
VVGKDDAFKITLTSKGKAAKTLKVGTYTFVIQDDSTIHNYSSAARMGSRGRSRWSASREQRR